eukprot:gene7628-8923_t
MVENLLSQKFYQTLIVNVNLSPEVQIYKASLVFQAKLSGLEYYLYHYPTTSFVIGFSSLFIFWSLSSLFTIVSLFLYRHFNQEVVEKAIIVGDNQINEEKEEEKYPELWEGIEDQGFFGASKLAQKKKIRTDLESSSSSSAAVKPYKYLWEEDWKDFDSLDLAKDKKNNEDSFILKPSKIKIEKIEDEPTIETSETETPTPLVPEVKKEEAEEEELAKVLEEVQEKIVDEASSNDLSTAIKQEEEEDDKSKETSSYSSSFSPSPPSSDQETYGNSGTLGNDDWHLVDGVESAETIRKRKTH